MPLSKIQDIDNQVIPNLGRRNLIINGGTLIWQRATAATASVNAQLTTCDRVMNQYSHGGATTTERSTDVPAGQGFQYSLKHVVTTADASMGTDDYYDIYQTRLEGNDIAQLCYGTSSAKKTSLSFWVKSSVAGVYNGAFTSHTAKVKLPFNFTISSANTWEHIKIENLPGATAGADDGESWITSGNNLGLVIRIFGMLGTRWRGATDRTWNTASAETAYGSSNSQVNWMGTLNNTFYITGVQLEVGDSATDFEHRKFAEELALCQRYHYRRDIGIYDIVAIGHALGDRGGYVLHTPVSMRAKPSVSQGSHIHCWYNNAGSVTAQNNLVVGYMATGQTDTNQFYLRADSNSTVQTGYGLGLTMYHGSVTSSHVTLSAEI